MSKRLTIEEFISRSKFIHGDKYDYVYSVYGKNNLEKIIIVCKIHGKFIQSPHDHLSGNGCLQCSIKSIPQHKPKSLQIFINESQKVHGNRYDYSKVKYISSHVKVQIICPIHGEFSQCPHDHLKGQKCRQCGYEERHLNNGFKWKFYVFPDGKCEKLQGYEPLTIDYLLSSIPPCDIKIHRTEKPIIYYDWSGSIHRYFPDCYIPSTNTIIETKSTYTWSFQEEQNKAKISGSLNSGYNIRFIIWNRNHTLHSDITYKYGDYIGNNR